MRVVKGVRRWLMGAGLQVAMAGVILTAAFLVFREPSADDKALEPTGALDDVTYAVPEWLWQVGLSLVAAGVVTMALAWFSSQPWYDGIETAKTSARTELAFAAVTIVVALGSSIVAVAVSWDASPEARLLGPIVGIVALLALLTSPKWLPWWRRKYG